MDPSDQTAQQVVKALIQEQVILRGLLQSQLRREFSRNVAALSGSIEAYNRDCATRVRFETDVQMARRDPLCPTP